PQADQELEHQQRAPRHLPFQNAVDQQPHPVQPDPERDDPIGDGIAEARPFLLLEELPEEPRQPDGDDDPHHLEIPDGRGKEIQPPHKKAPEPGEHRQDDIEHGHPCQLTLLNPSTR
ncbi:MAG: hypothetical protein UU07_C0042G0001, partial [Parcubacteria group bacterium GW2011_GWF1_40_5]